MLRIYREELEGGGSRESREGSSQGFLATPQVHSLESKLLTSAGKSAKDPRGRYCESSGPGSKGYSDTPLVLSLELVLPDVGREVSQGLPMEGLWVSSGLGSTGYLGTPLVLSLELVLPDVGREVGQGLPMEDLWVTSGLGSKGYPGTPLVLSLESVLPDVSGESRG